MDELSEEDKLTVARARKIQRFLSQPFQVAEVFTGHLGKLVPLKETIKGFKSILGGECGSIITSMYSFSYVWGKLQDLSLCGSLIVPYCFCPQASTTPCPSRPSTWSVPSRK